MYINLIFNNENFYLYNLFIKFCFNQIAPKAENETKENIDKNKEIKILEINYNILNDSDIQFVNDYQNSNDKKFILNEQTYIIYPSNNKEIEQISSILSTHIKNNTSINIGVTPNMAMKMTNKIKNNFIQLILENKNNENINDIVNIKINHRKILIKAKELVGINRGINIIKQLLIGNNPGNNSYTEIHFGPKQIIIIANIKNNNYIYFGILISFILILFSFYIIKRNQL